MRIKLCLFFILVANMVLAQESGSTTLEGKISANTLDLEGVYVINLKTEKSTITDKEGYFSIAAIPGDTLIFSAVHLNGMRIGLEQKDFENEMFTTILKSKNKTMTEFLMGELAVKYNEIIACENE